MLFCPPKPICFQILTHLEHNSGDFEEVWGWKRGREAHWERIAGTSLEVLRGMWISFLLVCEQHVQRPAWPQWTHSCLKPALILKGKIWAVNHDMMIRHGTSSGHYTRKKELIWRTFKFLATGQDLSSHDWIFSSKMSLIPEMANGFQGPTWSTGLKARSETHMEKAGNTFKLRPGTLQRKVIYL